MHTYIKRGFFNLITYGTSAFIARILNFLFLPFFVTQLSLAELGLWEWYQTFFLAGNLLFSSIASAAATRFYHLYAHDAFLQRMALSNICGMILMSIGMIGISALGLSILMPAGATSILLVSSNIILFALFSLLLLYARLKQYLSAYFCMAVTQGVIACCGTVLAINYGCGAQSFFYSNAFSLLLFVPGYVMLLKKYRAYGSALLREQLQYSTPLFVYTLIYTIFFTIDRTIICWYGGYDLLGHYSIVWRFAVILQFFSIALQDALPFVIYSAYDSKQTTTVMQIMQYALIALLCGVTGVILLAVGMKSWFPATGQLVMHHIPCVLFFMGAFECTRVLQIGFNMIKKTAWQTVVALFFVVTHAMTILCMVRFGIGALLIGCGINSMAYGMVTHYVLQRWGGLVLIDAEKLYHLFTLLMVLTGVAYYWWQTPIALGVCLVFVWVLFLLRYSSVGQNGLFDVIYQAGKHG